MAAFSVRSQEQTRAPGYLEGIEYRSDGPEPEAASSCLACATSDISRAATTYWRSATPPGKWTDSRPMRRNLLSFQLTSSWLAAKPDGRQAYDDPDTDCTTLAADPIGSGLVSSLAPSGGNVTGMSALTPPDLASKRVGLLKELVPECQTRRGFMEPQQSVEGHEWKDTQISPVAGLLLPFDAQTPLNLTALSRRSNANSLMR